MKKRVFSSVACIFLSASLLHAGDANRDRTHSVNKAIQKITKVTEKAPSIVEQLHNVVKDGKVTGQFRTLYSGFNHKNTTNTYATAVGGMLKYETAQYKGVSAAAAMVTTNDIRALSGAEEAHNDGLSGKGRSYTQLSEAYLNYSYKALTLRGGRQIIDTPLADSDDIRMLPNTFEAYTMLYNYKNLTFMLSDLERWQGRDAGIDNGWSKTGKNGVQLAGVSFSDKLLDASAWYYNISDPSSQDIANGSEAVANRTLYSDLSAHINLDDGVFLHLNLQYLLQKELDASNIAANIYGFMGEVVYHKFGIRVAYNGSKKEQGKKSFGGYGGGTLYTSMDTMILDEITADRDAHAVMGAMSYHYKHLKFLYAYGDFRGHADSLGIKAHIVEQNIAAKYKYNKAVTVGAIYVLDRNKEEPKSLAFNDDNVRFLFIYNF